MVRDVPTVFDWTRRRLTPWVVLPPRVQVPVSVMADENERASVLIAVPVRVRLVIPPILPPVKATPEQEKTRLVPFQFIPDDVPAPAPVNVITAVLAANVIAGVPPVVSAVPPLVSVIALAPKVSARVFEAVEVNNPHEQVCPLVFRVTVVRVTVAVEPIVIASVSCQEPAVPLKVRLARVLVPVVTVWTVVEVLMKEIAEVATSPRV